MESKRKEGSNRSLEDDELRSNKQNNQINKIIYLYFQQLGYSKYLVTFWAVKISNYGYLPNKIFFLFGGKNTILDLTLSHKVQFFKMGSKILQSILNEDVKYNKAHPKDLKNKNKKSNKNKLKACEGKPCWHWSNWLLNALNLTLGALTLKKNMC